MRKVHYGTRNQFVAVVGGTMGAAVTAGLLLGVDAEQMEHALGLPGVGHEAVEGLGENYLMRQIAYKRYPVGGPNQTPLYVLLQLIKMQELTADDIEQIEVSVSRRAFYAVTTNQHPSVNMETILCLAGLRLDSDRVANLEKKLMAT